LAPRLKNKTQIPTPYENFRSAPGLEIRIFLCFPVTSAVDSTTRCDMNLVVWGVENEA